MRIFVTGATGFIGTAVVRELRDAGHQVLGLTRSPEGARRLEALGAQARVGRLDQPNTLRDVAGECDGVIHTAFMHGLSHMSARDRIRLFAGALNGGIVSSFMRILQATETRAIDALGSALTGSGRPLIVTSGVLFLPPGQISHETDSHVAGPTRAFSESAALAFVPRGVRAAIVRLPPSVHAAGDHGFIPQIISAARKRGVSMYIGDGSNRWPAIHRDDAARLFRLALEKGEAGARYHGVAETGIEFREIATRIARRLDVATASAADTRSAKRHFGILSNFVGADNPSSSDWTRSTLGWSPKALGLLADMDANYFEPSTLAAVPHNHLDHRSNSN